MDASTIWHLILCSIVGIAACLHAFNAYRFKRSVTVIDLAYWSTSAYFGLGPWAAFAYGKGTLPSEDVDVLVNTYMGVGLFLVGLRFAKLFKPAGLLTTVKPNTGLFHLFQNTQTVSFGAILASLSAVWATRLCLSIVYGMGISGSVNEETLANLPYVLFILSSIMEVVAFACLLCASGMLFFEPQKRWYALVIIALEMIWSFGQGRRWVLSLVIVVVLAFLSTGRRIKISHLLSGGGLVVFCILWAFPAFLAFRSQYVSSSSNQNAWSSMLEAGRIAVFEDVEDSSLAFKENMSERPLIVGFNFRINEAQKQCDFMWGGAIANTFLWIVPSVLFPGKQDIIPSEESIERHYGLEIVDTSSNWPAFAAADFGLVGTFCVGLALGLLLLLLEAVALLQSEAYPFVGFCILGVAVAIAITVEETPVFAWANLRNLFLIALFQKLVIPLFNGTGISQIFAAGAVKTTSRS